MNWLKQISILLVIIGQVLSDLMCLSSNGCSCNKTSSNMKDIIDVGCGSYTVNATISFVYSWSIIIIECYSDQILQWGQHFNQISTPSIQFSKCHLSKTGIHQIISILGINQVINMTIFDMRLNGSLENAYLSNLQSVKQLRISDTTLILTNESFEGTPYLIYLNLRANDIEEIPKGVFKHLTQLKELSLAENRITIINSNSADDFPLIRKLDLYSNYLTTLTLNVQSLEYLDVSNNSLKNFEPEALNFPKLKTFKLEHNKISSLTSNSLFLFRYLVEVETIDLSNNYIKCIDQGWTYLKKLKIINLTNNNFAVLGLQEFQYINEIKITDISSNPLEEIDLSDLEEIAKAQPPQNKLSSNGQIYLSSDKLICDCRNYEFARFLHKQMPPTVYKYLKIESTFFCNNGLHTEFLNLNIYSLTCDWKRFKDVDKTDCLSDCECTYRPHDKSGLMDCSNRNLLLAPGKIISSRNLNYTELNLSHNSITKLPNYENYNIKKLNIGYNNLNTVNITQLPKNLTELHLEHNNITMISEPNDLNNISIITMSSNPWKCDCDAKDTINFIYKYSSKIVDFPDCYDSSILLNELTVQKVCKDKSNTVTITTVSMFLAVLSLILFFSLLWIVYTNYNVKVWLYSHNITCLISEESLDQDKKYDAFLSYSHKDQDLVIKHLLPGLEEGSPSFRICIHERDWVPGDFILDQIARSVDESRRTIIVLSKHFVDSFWGRTEFRVAYTNALSERQSRIIVILYGDVLTNDLDSELKMYLSINTYIQWGDSWFWDKLRYALRNRPETKTKTRTKIIVPDELNSIPLM